VWLRNLLAEQGAGGGASRALLTRVVADLAGGKQNICGAFIASEVIGPLAEQLLPELEAALDRLGGPLAAPPAPAVKWPERSRGEVRELAARLDELPAVETLPPYRTRRSFAVGGLRAVGFAPGTEMLLVVSWQGLGVFDGDGERVAREAGELPDPAGYPESAEGIGPIAGVAVPLMGFEGSGALPRSTRDGWQLGVLEPDDCLGIWTAPPGASLEPPGAGCVRLARRCEEIRAAGYSPSGQILVIAEQHTLHLFR
jgi:hypothetical protein